MWFFTSSASYPTRSDARVQLKSIGSVTIRPVSPENYGLDTNNDNLGLFLSHSFPLLGELVVPSHHILLLWIVNDMYQVWFNFLQALQSFDSWRATPQPTVLFSGL